MYILLEKSARYPIIGMDQSPEGAMHRTSHRVPTYQEHMAIECVTVQSIYIYRNIYIKFSGAVLRIFAMAFWRWHFGNAHSHAAILRMRIFTLPFSGCAFWEWQRENAHSHYIFSIFIYVKNKKYLFCRDLPCAPVTRFVCLF